MQDHTASEDFFKDARAAYYHICFGSGQTVYVNGGTGVELFDTSVEPPRSLEKRSGNIQVKLATGYSLRIPSGKFVELK